MLKNDKWIIEQAQKGMITPFEPSLIRQIEDTKAISYGSSSYGYDLRLSENDFKTFYKAQSTEINPKNLDLAQACITEQLYTDDFGSYFYLPPLSYALGVSKEKLSMPPNVTAITYGKSTYARSGIIANVTPIEAGWEGYLTIGLFNANKAKARLYANEGIIQILFLEGAPCRTTYSDRQGKYQGQAQTITGPKV